MARPRMDDAAYLTSLLAEWGAPATLQATLTAGGFNALATVAFAAEEGSDEAPLIRALLRITDDPLPVNPSVANALLAPANEPKLTAEMAKFLSHYPGELLSPEITPSLHLRSALDNKGLLWVPWRLRSSEADVLHWQESHRPRTDKQSSAP